MLREIYCEKFHQQRVLLDSGFNVVLGTNDGENSIGKSTFMLIIDFVFGGELYSKESDILAEVGPHRVCWKFEFGDKTFSFARDITKSSEIVTCDEQYKDTGSMTVKDYCQWLSEQYQINFYELTFRDAVGRYIRAYGKKNFDENRPLHAVPEEKASKSILALLKLFNTYEVIAGLEDEASSADEALSAFKKAQKLEFIDKISKTTYRKNQKDILALEKEVRSISDSLEHGLSDVDSAASEEAIQLKKELSRARRIRSNLYNKLVTLNENSEYQFSQTTDAFSELLKYFPEANLKHIEEVETFHKTVASIFRSELAEEQKNIKSQINDCDKLIADIEGQLRTLIKNPNLSKIVLEKYSAIMKQIEKKTAENNSYDQLSVLTQSKRDSQAALEKVKGEQLGITEKAINAEMEKINRMLYDADVSSPTIHFGDSNYQFFTPRDTGTGIAYKGLVVFDLAILNLTNLPLIVHDSVVLKQISDSAIERIIEQYISCGKQVIIALDKQKSYGSKTAEMLDKHAILRLGPNSEALFGRSWSRKDN